jgi:Gamma interferon inducible lysosomal thiol reductase (GILT)
VFYESKCPDSRNFMKYQMQKAYPKIKDRVKINYVPFGKSNVKELIELFSVV